MCRGSPVGRAGYDFSFFNCCFRLVIRIKIRWQRELSPLSEKIVIKAWGNELSSVLIVLHNATENEGVFLKYQSLKSVYFWFRLDAPAVSRSQGKFLIGPRLGLIYIFQYSWIFFTSVILNWRLIFTWFVRTLIF